MNMSNYSVSGGGLPPPPTPMGAPQGPMPPYGRGGSPRPEVRPILDNRMPSPKSAYPHPAYQAHAPESLHSSSLANGAPPPPSAMAAAEVAAHERSHERSTSVGPKRMREWDDEQSPIKKPASDEARSRMMDERHRRQSTSPRERDYRRSSSEARRVEEQRRANENYHPSEAAHHPHTHNLPPQLPPMQAGSGPAHEQKGPLPPPPAPRDYVMEERDVARERERQEHSAPPPPPAMGEPERAARKMDVDEDYDDEGDDDKKPSGPATGGPASAAEGKNRSPSAGSSGQPNGINGQIQAKVEASN
jgi:glucose repression mediator protein